MNIHTFKIGDKILVVSIAIIVVIFIAWNTFGAKPGENITAVITQNGKVIKEIKLNDLQDPEYVYIKGEINQVILAEKGRIRFLESNCPTRTCVNTGWLTKAGNKAVCIPSKVVITLTGEQEVDIYLY
ncbi:MAG: NusG domain II-containing protein [Syntrophaceticus sp.]|jgi:hypothetical protein